MTDVLCHVYQTAKSSTLVDAWNPAMVWLDDPIVASRGVMSALCDGWVYIGRCKQAELMIRSPPVRSFLTFDATRECQRHGYSFWSLYIVHFTLPG